MATEASAQLLTPLNTDERRALLRLARDSIRAAFRDEAPPLPCLLTPQLQAPGAAFVSLHLRAELRGCVGTLRADHALYVSVAERARAAAFEDPRFAPLTVAELAEVEIEISRLSRLQPAGPTEVVPGIHGVAVTAGERRGVFLPQVAPRYGWDAETLLAEVCLKASLPPDAWQWAETRLEIFEAEVFGETAA